RKNQRRARRERRRVHHAHALPHDVRPPNAGGQRQLPAERRGAGQADHRQVDRRRGGGRRPEAPDEQAAALDLRSVDRARRELPEHSHRGLSPPSRWPRSSITYDYKLEPTTSSPVRFARSLCQNFDTLQKSVHPKWREVSLALPELNKGWTYYPPISRELRSCTAQRTKAASRRLPSGARPRKRSSASAIEPGRSPRSEEHTSELQSLTNLVCRLLLEKKKHTTMHPPTTVPPL